MAWPSQLVCQGGGTVLLANWIRDPFKLCLHCGGGFVVSIISVGLTFLSTSFTLMIYVRLKIPFGVLTKFAVPIATLQRNNM